MGMKRSEIRQRLYREYIHELGLYDIGLMTMGDSEIDKWSRCYQREQMTDWLDIRSADGQIVGFLIVSWDRKNCHPQCDYYICQAFITKLYRHKGLMSRAVRKYLSTHSGIYGLDVLNQNYNAHQFWDNIFERYRRVNLEEVRSREVAHNLMLFGYMVN